MREMKNPISIAIIISVLLLSLMVSMNPHSVRADTTGYVYSPDYSGVGIYSPLNTTYNSRNLTLNVTIGTLGMIHSDGGPYNGPVSLKYSIDGIDYGEVPLFTNAGTHVFISGYGTVDLPELPDGSHCLTLYLYGYNTRSINPQFKSYVDTVYFSINTPTPTESPTPIPQPTTIQATETDGTNVTLALGGNITCAQISGATIASSQSENKTTISFTLTGESGTSGLGNVTIQKSDVPYGTTPVIYIDNQEAQNQGSTQDANNYYVWYTTQFSTHQVSIVFSGSSSSSLFIEIAAAVAIVAIVAAGLLVYWKKR
jgi:hypothetical protein